MRVEYYAILEVITSLEISQEEPRVAFLPSLRHLHLRSPTPRLSGRKLGLGSPACSSELKVSTRCSLVVN